METDYSSSMENNQHMQRMQGNKCWNKSKNTRIIVHVVFKICYFLNVFSIYIIFLKCFFFSKIKKYSTLTLPFPFFEPDKKERRANWHARKVWEMELTVAPLPILNNSYSQMCLMFSSFWRIFSYLEGMQCIVMSSEPWWQYWMAFSFWRMGTNCLL